MDSLLQVGPKFLLYADDVEICRKVEAFLGAHVLQAALGRTYQQFAAKDLQFNAYICKGNVQWGRPRQLVRTGESILGRTTQENNLGLIITGATGSQL